ncbi:MAG: hypothetical protein PUI30_02655, partial [Bacteroidales bacterium]|nr:hypothetical protein [Bacteroidales bacterium]
MKKINIFLCAVMALFTSCSDVDLESVNFSEAVTNLIADYQDGKRDVTLSWTNPTMEGQSGIQIIQDDKDITNIDEVINSYYIQKAPTNTDVSYTVKARYSDGRVSEGQTVRFYINYEAKKGGNMVAMLVAD